MRRLLITPLILAAALAAVAPVWSATPAVPPPDITLTAAEQAALGIRSAAVQTASAQTITASASVTVPPGREHIVTAPLAGTITRLEAGLGDAVRPGTPLLRFSSPALAELRRQAREAQLEAQNALAALQRDQSMHEEGLIPTARLQLSLNRQRIAESAAQAQAAMLQSSGASPIASGEDYASGSVRAPAMGQIVETLVQVGQRVEAGTVLLRIADLRQLQLELTLSPDKAGRVRTGDEVVVPDRDATATVLGVGRALDASQQVHARARVLKTGRLQAGETLTVEIRPRQAKTEAPAWQVPARAVVQLRGKPRVFRVTPQGYSVLEIEVLSSNDEFAVVRGALSAADRVAVGGIAALRAIAERDE